jgi:hypothetical protein
MQCSGERLDPTVVAFEARISRVCMFEGYDTGYEQQNGIGRADERSVKLIVTWR